MLNILREGETKSLSREISTYTAKTRRLQNTTRWAQMYRLQSLFPAPSRLLFQTSYMWQQYAFSYI